MENRVMVALLLHFFQPWWQKPEVLDEIIRTCYKPVFDFVAINKSRFLFTANISGSLFEFFSRHDPEIPDQLRNALAENQVELMSTAAHHPIVPLIPFREIGKQIVWDLRVKEQHAIFGNCGGFFFPEMAFSGGTLSFMKSFGFEWTVLEDNVLPSHSVPFNFIAARDGFRIFLRSSHWSRYVWDGHLDFMTFKEKMRYELPDWIGRNNAYIVLAMDVETFGHHNPELLETFLFPALAEWGRDGTLVSFGDLLKLFQAREVRDIKEGSWATTEDDFRANNPYPLWNSPDNKCHQLLWELARLAFKYTDRPESWLDGLKMADSCHWWWVSRRPHFRPEIMILGAEKAYGIIHQFGSVDDKSQAAELIVALRNFAVGGRR